jgi:hypothetical protein
MKTNEEIDLELASQIHKEFEYLFRAWRKESAIETMAQLITTARRAEREEIERLKLAVKLSDNAARNANTVLVNNITEQRDSVKRQLTLANAALELCERALHSLPHARSCYDGDNSCLCHKQQALSAIKEIKKDQPEK